jgi:hypothetical protein
MKPAWTFKHFIAAFVVTLAVYAVFFHLIEHHRAKNGPWRVTFVSSGGGSAPCLIIDEPRLDIANLKITFPGGSAPATNATVVFDRPREVPFSLPFGDCVFMDAITLPGTVVVSAFGHEVQMLPRVLTIDKKEYTWQSNATLKAAP